LRVAGVNESNADLTRNKILFMDDEVMIRNLMTEILGFLGYEAVCAKDGEEALTLFERERTAGRKFSAIILDLVIPDGMGFRGVFPKVHCSAH
jgi:DNA-binding response OmpR family regulator